MTQSPLTSSDVSDETKKFIADKRKGAEMAICKRLDRAVEDGELSSDVSTADLAKFYTVVIQGLALQAQHGGIKDLLRVVAVAMDRWPTKDRA